MIQGFPWTNAESSGEKVPMPTELWSQNKAGIGTTIGTNTQVLRNRAGAQHRGFQHYCSATIC
ncbi:MAG: hypothetical protein CSA62_11420 [Planctomycetota bacterium]|nr:MAG: hypothetical protein CSA62_11420 [Planctomycetota bacterium]